MSTKNIVLFGQSGAGKSSVVNLIAGQERAKTSPGTVTCTLHWEEHSIAFDGYSYKVFDTVGLEEPHLEMEGYLNAITNAHSLITQLKDAGGIDLLLFCLRAGQGKITAQHQSNYRIFYEWLCEKKVPVVIVLTGLEREQKMEDWWAKNKHQFQKHGIKAAGHACITAVSGPEGRDQELHEESRRLVRGLVTQHTPRREGFFKKAMQKLRKFKCTRKRKDIETVLTKRCGVTREAAKELASKIRSIDGQSLPSLGKP